LLTVADREPPRVDRLELGFVVLAERLSPRLASWLQALRRRASVRRTGRFGVPWERVREVKRHHVELDLVADETPAFDWERWLRKDVVERIPGSAER
jgi:hypothetical protein